MDLTPAFDELLQKHGVSPKRTRFDIEAIDGYLKEAYRINSHITKLHQELKDVRRAYLSTAQPRRMHGRQAAAHQGQPRVLSDREREEVDANAKQMIRELNASIRTLDDAEQLRRETESALLNKKYGSGLGALGSWASGGIVGGKTPELQDAEAQAEEVGVHRDGVLWYLRHELELCCRTQQDMMKVRLTREFEMSRSLLSQAGGAPPLADFAEYHASSSGAGSSHQSKGDSGTNDEFKAEENLSAEQIQMFEEGNQDMMKYYESTLDKVRTAEKSLREISELQSLLVNNLSTQAAHIEQLVTDSFSTTENVGSGNKELKKATQRPSAARYTFFAASGLCAFLVVWDLLF